MFARIMLWCGALMGISYLLPNHYAPWMSFHSQLVAAVAFAPVMVWAALRAGAVPALSVGALVLSLTPLVQWGLGQIYFSSDATLTFLYLAGFALAVLAGARVVQHASQTTAPLKALEGIWVALAFSAIVSVGIAIHQWLSLSGLYLYIVELQSGARPFANLGQPNQFASLLLLGIAGVAFLFESRTVRAWVAVLATMFLIFGLVMSGSRSALTSTVWLLIAYALLRKRCGVRTTPMAMACLSLFFIGMALLWSPLNQALLLGDDGGSPIARMETPGMRWHFWQSMLDAALRAPWGGYGWGQVAIAFNHVALDHPPTRGFYDSAHNLLLDAVLQIGIPAGSIAIAGLVSWFVGQIRQCRDALSWTVLVAIGFVFNHAMFEFPLNYAFFLLPIGFFMGALSAVHPTFLDKKVTRFQDPSARPIAVAMAAVCLSLLVMVVYEYPSIEADWSNMVYDEEGFLVKQTNIPPTPLLLTELSELIRFARTKAAPGMPLSELEWMRHVSERYGYPSSLYRYALALALNGHPAEASTVLQKLCSTSIAPSCASAKKTWETATKEEFPQLVNTPFPATP